MRSDPHHIGRRRQVGTKARGRSPSGSASLAMYPTAYQRVTFLFTDIEGSTALWEQHPDAMRQALVRHDALVEQIVAQHAGSWCRHGARGTATFGCSSPDWTTHGRWAGAASPCWIRAGTPGARGWTTEASPHVHH